MAARADTIAAGPALRRSGLQPIGNVEWGTHFCQFYLARQDLLEIVIPYFRAGLEDGEFCLCVTCEPMTPAEARRALLEGLENAEHYLASGQIEIVGSRDWYCDAEEFNPHRVIRGWREKLRRALEQGYAGMRVHANEAWLTRRSWKAFRDYEASLDESLRGEPILVLCTYPLEGATGEEVFDVAQTHQFSIARRHGEWEVMETTTHVGACEQAQRRNVELEARVARRTAELESANARLAQREQHYRFLAENTKDVISLYRPDDDRIYVSPSFRRLVGDTLPDKTFGGVHPSDLANVMAAWDEARAGKSKLVRYRHRHADGSWRWVEASNTPVDYDGAPHILVVSRDVTDRVRLEDQLQHAQKMEALGRLAGGVAHDFNNILTAIFGYLDLARGEVDRGGDADRHIGEIRANAERARKLTRQLLTFSRRELRHLQVVDLGDVVAAVEPMLRLLLRQDITLDLVRAADPLRVFIDPGQLEQVLVNLIVNARDAIGAGGGLVRVETGYKAVLEDDGTVPDFVRPGRYARLSVADDGSGMPPEVAAMVFEPFFTTKPPGLGTGLGLSTVFGIVRQSGGFIWPDSRLGEGTSFTVLIPISEQAKTVEAPEAHAGHGESVEGLHIVLVESDESVRRLLVETLAQGGAFVHGFACARDALSLLADVERALDVLICEMPLRDIPLSALLGIASRSRPDLRIIVASGEEGEPSAHETLPAGTILLRKPFGGQELIDAVAGG